MRTDLRRLVGGLTSVLAFAGASRAASPANVDWPVYLGDKGRRLYSPLQQINRTNVTQLKVAWIYDTGDRGEYQANDLIVARRQKNRGMQWSAATSDALAALRTLQLNGGWDRYWQQREVLPLVAA